MAIKQARHRFSLVGWSAVLFDFRHAGAIRPKSGKNQHFKETAKCPR